jgi:CheY-specific phosphatase CheX
VNESDHRASAETIERTVVNVYETMMGLSLEPRDVPWSSIPDRVSATVQFSGRMNGALVLEMEPVLARKFAGCLLGMQPSPIVDDQVRDAIGEITNVIAGNLNGSIGQGSTLSMPYVVDGSNFRIRICCNTEIVRQAFADATSVFWVSWIMNCQYDPCRCADAPSGIHIMPEEM